MNLFRLGLVAVIAYLGYHFGAPIPLKDQWPLFEALRTTTSIVFGVMGALLALVYPDAVKNALRNGPSTQESDGGLKRLITPCGHSALLLILLVFVAPIISWLGTFDPKEFAENVTLFQQVTFSIFCILSYWQISILLMVLIPFDDLYMNVHQGIQRQRMRRNMHSNGRN
jgi:fumarate reductase subunit D